MFMDTVMAIATDAFALLPTIQFKSNRKKICSLFGIYLLAKCKLTNQSITSIMRMKPSTCKRCWHLMTKTSHLIVSFLAANQFKYGFNTFSVNYNFFLLSNDQPNSLKAKWFAFSCFQMHIKTLDYDTVTLLKMKLFFHCSKVNL